MTTRYELRPQELPVYDQWSVTRLSNGRIAVIVGDGSLSDDAAARLAATLRGMTTTTREDTP